MAGTETTLLLLGSALVLVVTWLLFFKDPAVSKKERRVPEKVAVAKDEKVKVKRACGGRLGGVDVGGRFGRKRKWRSITHKRTAG